MPETQKMNAWESRRGEKHNFMMIRIFRAGIIPGRRKEIFVYAFDLEIGDILCHDFSVEAQRIYPKYALIKSINKHYLSQTGMLDIQYEVYENDPLEETKVLG